MVRQYFFPAFVSSVKVFEYLTFLLILPRFCYRARSVFRQQARLPTLTSLTLSLPSAETFITPYQFSSIFCEDVGIPVVPHANTIADLISGQVEEAQNAVEIDVADAQVTEDQVVWSDEEVEGQIMVLEEEMEKAWTKRIVGPS